MIVRFKGKLTFLLLLISGVSIAQVDTVKIKEVGIAFSNLNSFGLSYKSGKGNTLFRITAISLTGGNSSGDYNNYLFNGTNNSIPVNTSNSFGAGLNIGFEIRNPINPKFYFYYGAALIVSYSQTQTNAVTPDTYIYGYYNSSGVWTIQSSTQSNASDTKTWSLSSGVGIIIGFAYKLGQSLSIGAEVIPAVTYNYSSTNLTADNYAVNWKGNSTTGYTPEPYETTQTTEKINKGVSFSALNTGAAITLSYRFQ